MRRAEWPFDPVWKCLNPPKGPPRVLLRAGPDSQHLARSVSIPEGDTTEFHLVAARQAEIDRLMSQSPEGYTLSCHSNNGFPTDNGPFQLSQSPEGATLSFHERSCAW